MPAASGDSRPAATMSILEQRQLRARPTMTPTDTLLEIIVHDMRTPVGAAVLSLEYLALELKKQPENEALLEAAEDALGTLSSLSSMISQILDVAKLESGRITLRLDTTDVGPILDSTVQAMASRARLRSIQFSSQASPGLRTALDLRLFPRALEVLASYCLHRTREGGRILLTAARSTRGVRVSMRCDGAAIPVEERTKAFDKLPVSGAEPRRTSAWGLGLYYCRLVATIHGGTVGIEDVDGWPLSFVMELPSQVRPGS